MNGRERTLKDLSELIEKAKILEVHAKKYLNDYSHLCIEFAVEELEMAITKED